VIVGDAAAAARREAYRHGHGFKKGKVNSQSKEKGTHKRIREQKFTLQVISRPVNLLGEVSAGIITTQSSQTARDLTARTGDGMLTGRSQESKV
jgi:hypothetical protein